MSRYQQIANAVWMVAGVLIVIASTKLGILSAGGPSIGFIPSIAGALIAILGAFQFIQEARARDKDTRTFFPDRGAARRVVTVIATLIGTTLLMQPLGFLLTALLTMVVLLTVIERDNWLVTVAFALAASVGVWWLFTSLDVVLPHGPFGF